MAIQNRRGYEADFDPAKMLPGEWAVSLDTKYVRMCFAPGECLRMATYEGFEQDMVEVRRILAECRTIEDAVIAINTQVSANAKAVAEYASQAETYKNEAQTSAASAKASETNAKTSETNAKASETNAKVSEQNAQRVFESLPEDYSELSKAFYNTAIKQTATGKTIHLTDSADSKVVEFALYGKAEQKQYSGKNWLNGNGISEKTMNGVTFTPVKDENGLLLYVNVNGTATANAYMVFLNTMVLARNGEYIGNGCPSGGSSSKYWMQFNYVSSDGSLKGVMDYGNGVNYTDSSNASANREVYIFVSAGTTVSNLKFYPMIRKASITDPTYEPFVGNAPSPSPYYPQDIEVAGASGSIEGKSVGKNLISYPYDNTTLTNNGITFTDNGDGSVTVNGTATANVGFNCQSRGDTTNPFCLKKGTYKASGCPVGGSSSTYTIAFGKTEPTTGNYVSFGFDYGKEITFTLDEDSETTQVQIIIYKGATLNNLIFKPMISLEGGEYEPYKETIATISTPDGLASIPNTEVCDTVYKYADGSGKRIQRTKNPVSDDMTLIKHDYSNDDYFVAYIQSSGVAASLNALSSHFTYSKLATSMKTSSCVHIPNIVGPSPIHLSVPVSIASDVTALKQWLLDNDVKIYYPLAEPIITDLTAEEIAEIEKLHTFYPVTNISNDADCDMEVTYLADAKNYIDGRLASIEFAMINKI